MSAGTKSVSASPMNREVSVPRKIVHQIKADETASADANIQYAGVPGYDLLGELLSLALVSAIMS